MKFCLILILFFFLLGCSDEKINSIPSIFRGDWIEIGEYVDLKVNHPSELMINADGFKMIQFNDVDDLTDTVIFDINNNTIFRESENSIKIVNNDKDASRFREIVLTYSDGILYLREFMSTGLSESGTEILGSGANLKFVRTK